MNDIDYVFEKVNLANRRGFLVLDDCLNDLNDAELQMVQMKIADLGDALIGLSLNNNSLKKWDISNNEKLSFFQCSNNDLRQITVGKNQDLMNVIISENENYEVDNLKGIMSLNSLSRLDVKNSVGDENWQEYIKTEDGEATKNHLLNNVNLFECEGFEDSTLERSMLKNYIRIASYSLSKDTMYKINGKDFEVKDINTLKKIKYGVLSNSDGFSIDLMDAVIENLESGQVVKEYIKEQYSKDDLTGKTTAEAFVRVK